MTYISMIRVSNRTCSFCGKLPRDFISCFVIFLSRNILSQAQELMDQILASYKGFLKRADRSYRHAAGKHAIRCRQGCRECCATGFFDITLLDALYLHEMLNELPASVRKRIIAKSEEQLDTLEEKKLFSRRNPYLRSAAAINALACRSAEMSCPALGDTGKCLIYSRRPHICRVFGPTVRGFRRKVWLKGCRYFSKEIPEEDIGMADQYAEELTMKTALFQQAGRTRIHDVDTIIPAALALDLGNWL